MFNVLFLQGKGRGGGAFKFVRVTFCRHWKGGPNLPTNAPTLSAGGARRPGGAYVRYLATAGHIGNGRPGVVNFEWCVYKVEDLNLCVACSFYQLR